ncbi:MAG: hypothetical protein ACWA6U_16285, partial [Breznakibacter sp.]
NLKLYNYYSSRTNPGIRDPITGFSWGKGNTYNFEKYLMQKGDNLLKKPEKLAFKNDMVEYFADCPALVEKLEKKEYKKDDIESIVRFYNRNCK